MLALQLIDSSSQNGFSLFYLLREQELSEDPSVYFIMALIHTEITAVLTFLMQTNMRDASWSSNGQRQAVAQHKQHRSIRLTKFSSLKIVYLKRRIVFLNGFIACSNPLGFVSIFLKPAYLDAFTVLDALFIFRLCHQPIT